MDTELTAVRAYKQLDHDKDEAIIQAALRLIKRHITSEETNQNRDLHTAVGLVVDFARNHGHCDR